MKTEDLFHACNVADADEMADELQRILNHLMTYYGRSPIGYEGEAAEMAKAHLVITAAIQYFSKLELEDRYALKFQDQCLILNAPVGM